MVYISPGTANMNELFRGGERPLEKEKFPTPFGHEAAWAGKLARTHTQRCTGTGLHGSSCWQECREGERGTPGISHLTIAWQEQIWRNNYHAGNERCRDGLRQPSDHWKELSEKNQVWCGVCYGSSEMTWTGDFTDVAAARDGGIGLWSKHSEAEAGGLRAAA